MFKQFQKQLPVALVVSFCHRGWGCYNKDCNKANVIEKLSKTEKNVP